MTNEINPGTVEAASRVRAYLAERSKMSGIDPVAINTLQASSGGKVALLVADLEALAAQSQPAATVQEGGNCERCQGNGEIVTDWDRYLHGHDGDQGDEAVAECPDCNGTGHVDLLPSTERMRDALETIAHHSDGSPKGWAAATALAALAEPAAKAGDAEGLWNRIADIIAERVSGPSVWEDHLKIAHRLDQLEAAKDIAKLFAPPSPQPDMGSGVPAIADAVFAFAKARAWHHFGIAWDRLERVSQDELIEQTRSFLTAAAALPPPASQSVEKMRTALAEYVAFAGEVAGTSLGLAMSSDHPSPDTALMGMFDKSQALATKHRGTLEALSTIPHKEEGHD